MSNIPRGAFMQVMEKYTKSLKAFISAQGFGHYSKPNGGIPKTDLASAVQTSLGLADSALQSETDPTVPAWAKAASKPSYTASEVGLGNVGNFKAVSTVASQGLSDTEKSNARANIGAGTGNGTYSKPSGGIPKTDLASAVQTSLGKADSALQSHQTIKQDGVTGATVNRFGTCSTASDTAAKTVSITSGTFNLEAGARVTVKFGNPNTANTPTLNVNSKGAKNIFHKGAQITTGNNRNLLAGTVDFIYDGTQWHLIGSYIDTNTTYSSKSAASGGTDVSLCTTGEKYTWNSKAAGSHTHGNIQNGGTLQTNDITIASGDKIVVTDSSDSNKIARTSISFDGSTATQALTKKGTWETFNNYSHPTSAGNKHIPSGGSSGKVLIYGGSSGTASWGDVPCESINPADFFTPYSDGTIDPFTHTVLFKQGKHIFGLLSFKATTATPLIGDVKTPYLPAVSRFTGIAYVWQNANNSFLPSIYEINNGSMIGYGKWTSGSYVYFQVDWIIA